MRTMPALVAKITHLADGWVVGSAADPANATPRDWDVIVPFRKWRDAALLIPDGATPNTFGGFKCLSEGIEVDIWPGDIDWLMQRPGTVWLWHPASGVKFKKQPVEQEL